ncbi:MAG TPA: hypothetical protein VF950_09805 [Planctomycetota bacterium]
MERGDLSQLRGGALTSIRGLIWRRRWGFSIGFLATSAAIVFLPYPRFPEPPGFGSGVDWPFLGLGVGFLVPIAFLLAGRGAFLSLATDD